MHLPKLLLAIEKLFTKNIVKMVEGRVGQLPYQLMGKYALLQLQPYLGFVF